MHVMPIYFLLSIEVARVKDLRDAVCQLGVAGTAVDREYVLARLKENVEALYNSNRFSTARARRRGKASESVATSWIRDRKAWVPEKAALPVIRQHQSW
jgi:hypothetical protein